MAMVEMGHDLPVERVYRNRARPDLKLEVFAFADLERRLPGEEFRRVHRLDFHQLTLVHSGEGTSMVDFVDVPCRPGTLLHTRPGQVQRLPVTSGGVPADLDATIIVFTPDFPPRLPATAQVTDEPFGPASWQLEREDYDRFGRALADLATEYADLEIQDVEITRELLRHILGCILLRIARLPATEEGAHFSAAQEPYRRFRHELERSFRVLRQAHDYAARAGYSLKTLNRACQQATGHTAKQLIDARVTLEARRLLAHTDLPVAAVSHRLGFTEPTNFSKFFVRATGQTPGAFRDAMG